MSHVHDDASTQPPSSALAPDVSTLPLQPALACVGSLPPGTTLGPGGRYRIGQLLGQGGFAETFSAYDTQLFDALCVIKRLHLHTGNSVRVQKLHAAGLVREAELLAALKTPGHPHIPEIYAYLEDEGCLVMKYVEGVSLQTVLEQRSTGLPEERALTYAYAACSALAYIHARATLHLDLKPANLLVDSTDWLWLIDFGIGRTFTDATQPTILGTPGYMPHEQQQGQPTPASDIYALGMTLYVLLSNYSPAMPCLPPVRQLVPDVRPEVDALICAATHADAAKRPSAHALLHQLRLLRAESTPSPRPRSLNSNPRSSTPMPPITHNVLV
ncbi:serine/threonine-protein kinase [Candidatus Viridilinea mediisalina]|uniref:Protein kinase domain-containing protein n=1 Tax=Candidatus Viridilinea mediisalina TaxID=2024553 RepID=A0A2A6RKT6_9CHLR|nr:serine/threonine-protein kinase [Candidatus Viridilinea mediisalina]PDW03553.1 hypothetical protein CJ255_08280 [Candidatus Viridilinea mediisalina]